MTKRKSIVFPIVAVIIVFVSIYFMTPQLYKTVVANHYNNLAIELVDEICESTKKNTTCTQFAIDHQAMVLLHDNTTSLKIETPTLSAKNTQTIEVPFTTGTHSYILQVTFSTDIDKAVSTTLLYALLGGGLILALALLLDTRKANKMVIEEEDDTEEFQDEVTNGIEQENALFDSTPEVDTDIQLESFSDSIAGFTLDQPSDSQQIEKLTADVKKYRDLLEKVAVQYKAYKQENDDKFEALTQELEKYKEQVQQQEHQASQQINTLQVTREAPLETAPVENFDKQVAKYKAAIRLLSSQLETAKKQGEQKETELLNEIDNFKDEIEKYKAMTSDADVKQEYIEKLTQQVEDYKLQVEHLQQSQLDLQDQSNQKIQELMTEIESFKNEIENYKSDIDNFKDEIDNYKNEIDNFKVEIENYKVMTSDADTKQEHIENLTKQVEDYSLQIDNLQQSQLALQDESNQKIQELMNEIENYKERIANHEALEEQLTTQTDAKVQEMTEKLEASQAELEQLSLEQQNQQSTHQEEIDELNSELEKAKNLATELSNNLITQSQETQNEIQRLNAQLERYKLLVQKMTEKEGQITSSYTRQITELQDALDKKTAEAATLNAKKLSIEDNSGQIKDLYREIANYQAIIARMKQEQAAPSNSWSDKENYDRIKKPIEQACACISKAILSERDFENQKLALIDARLKLTKIEESLVKTMPVQEDHFTSVQELFKAELSNYEFNALEKRCRIRYSFKSDFKVSCNNEHFYSLIKSLMTFILNQCDAQSNIEVGQNSFNIIISYKGAVLTEQSINYVKANDINMKEIYRLASLLDISVNFEESFAQTGMQFVFQF